MPSRAPWSNEYGTTFKSQGLTFRVLYGQGLRGPAGVQARLRILGSSPTDAGLPPAATLGDAWVTGPEGDSRARQVWVWNIPVEGGPGRWEPVFRFVAPAGPRPQHQWSGASLRFQNADGSWGAYVNLRGPKGDKGDKGEKGDIGNYLGFTPAGWVTSYGDLPTDVPMGSVYGVINDRKFYVAEVNNPTADDWAPFFDAATPVELPEPHLFYVSPDGSNSAGGRTRNTPLKDVQEALERAWNEHDSGNGFSTIALLSHAYGECRLPGGLALPPHCQVTGVYGARHTIVMPEVGAEEQNMFLVNDGCYISNLSVQGLQIDSFEDPGQGFLAATLPGALYRRTPYVFNCSVWRPFPAGFLQPPLDAAAGNPAMPKGGGVMLMDAAVANPYSVYAQGMAFAATPASPNGVGYVAKNGAYINCVAGIAVQQHRAFMAFGGAMIELSNCSTQMGDYSLWADGFRRVVVPARATGTMAPHVLAAQAIEANVTPLIDAMWAWLVANGYTTGWTADDEAFTRKDAAIFLQAMAWCLNWGDQEPARKFVAGLFMWNGDPVFDSSKLAAFTASFEKMRDDIIALGIASEAATMLTSLVAAVNTTLTTPVRRVVRSTVVAIQQQFSAPGAGVDLRRIPPTPGGEVKLGRIAVQRNFGRVIVSGQDSFGNVWFAGRGKPGSGLRYSARTGQLTGRAFEASVRLRAARIAMTRSFA